MSQITRLAQLLGAQVPNQDLTTAELVLGTLRLGGLSGTLIDSTTLATLISQSHAPMSDNQNVVAGNGLNGGGSGATVNLAVQPADASVVASGGGIQVGRSATGAIGLAGDGIAVIPDNSTLELAANKVQVKATGIDTAQLKDNAVDTNKLRSDPTVDANRPVSTNHIRDTAVTDAKIAAGVDAAKIADGSVSNTEFQTLDGISSNIQSQLNGKQATGNYVTALTGDVSASGPGSAAATVNSVGGSSAANVHSAELAANAATDTNTASTIVKRDASGNFAAGTITGTTTGNPPNARTISTTAPLTGGGDLSANRTIAIPKATGSVDGYLASTDFNTFNNKQNTLVYVDASSVLASGLLAATPVTLPGSATFSNAHASDIGIIVNKLWMEEGRDFTAVGVAPYTQIQFAYNLPNDTVLRVKQVK